MLLLIISYIGLIFQQIAKSVVP